jgi:scyllo-inositol 2-dehydrogenase (NADP+)
VLKGSLLCRAHRARYAVHGLKGSWVKEGLDPQEASIMGGDMPVYPRASEAAAAGGSTVLASAPAPAEGTGGTEDDPWGVLTDIDGDRRSTPAAVGSYHYLYDSLYDSIVNGAPPFISGTNSVAVIRLIDMAYESSKLGQVLQVST